MNPKLAYKKLGAKALADVAKAYKVADDISFVKRYLRKQDSILDLGCGYGRVAIPLARAGYTNIRGLDVAANLISEAKRQARKFRLPVQFDLGDMVHLPYPDASFDKIICLWNTFSELLTAKDQQKAFKEIKRVLKSEGLAVLVLADNRGLNRKVVTHRFGKGEFHHFSHTKETLRELAHNAKFKAYIVRYVKMHERNRILVTLHK